MKKTIPFTGSLSIKGLDSLFNDLQFHSNSTPIRPYFDPEAS